jgi:hypothetical protein
VEICYVYRFYSFIKEHIELSLTQVESTYRARTKDQASRILCSLSMLEVLCGKPERIRCHWILLYDRETEFLEHKT